jgi:hypothetical protein
MHYSSNCGCGCNYDCGCNTVPSTCCSTTNNITTTTTTPCIGEPCDELYNADCILYKGPNISCYGLNTNDSLSDIIDLIVSNIPDCINTDICFSITSGSVTQSCVLTPFDYWNNKPYYKIKFNNCTNLIGYVYWNPNSSEWEFSNQLGGGSIIYATLSTVSNLPVSSLPWTIVTSTYIIKSSLSGFCAPITTTSTSTTTTTTIPPTTTTTTLPCICLSLYYNAGMSPAVSAFTYKDCNTNNSTSGSIAPNTRKNICTKGLINYDTSAVSVDNLGACSANCTSTTTTTRAPLPTPTTTTSTTSTTTTTTASPTTTSTTTTLAPIDFTIAAGTCTGGLGTGTITISSYTGGSGNYQITNTTYTSSIAALNGTFINDIAPYTYTSVPNGTRYVAVRDTNNPSNVVAKSVVVNCSFSPDCNCYTATFIPETGSICNITYTTCAGVVTQERGITAPFPIPCFQSGSIMVNSGDGVFSLNPGTCGTPWC